MELPAHPLLALVESNKNGLKSMLTSYIDDTVDNQFAFLTNSILKMIQSGQIGSAVTTFAIALPATTQTITDQSSASCLNEYSNDQLTINHQNYQNTSQNDDTPLVSTDSILIKQEFNDDEGVMDEEEETDDDLEKINNVRVQECENCIKGICDSIGKNLNNTCGDESESGDNGNEPFDEPNDYASVENNQINQSLIISNDQDIKNENNTNDELQIDDKSDNLLQKIGDKLESSNQAAINGSIESTIPSTSAVRSSARKRIPKKYFDDLIQTNENTRKSGKRKNVTTLNKTVENTKRPKVEDEVRIDDADSDDREEEKDELKSPIITLEMQCTEPHCVQTVSSRASWRDHMWNDHHKSDPYHQIEKNTQLKEHGVTVYRCALTECNAISTTQSKLRQHWRRYHQPGKFKCKSCDFVQNFRFKVQKHFEATHGSFANIRITTPFAFIHED